MNFGNASQLGKVLSSNAKKLKDLDDEYKGIIDYNIMITASYDKLKVMRKTTLNSLKGKTNTIFQGKTKSIEKEYRHCRELCEKRMDCANGSFFLLENEIRKVNQITEKLEQEIDNSKYQEFSFQNYLLDKHFDELVNFDNFVNSKKRSKNKKTRNTLKNLNLNLNFSLNNLKNKRKLIDMINCNLIETEDENKKMRKGPRGKIKQRKVIENNSEDNQEDSYYEDITYREIDGKIGPKEQIYCFCNYVSYGNMIKCDNPKCKREWFHFHCVGLLNMPLGKWFCSNKCAGSNKIIK